MFTIVAVWALCGIVNYTVLGDAYAQPRERAILAFGYGPAFVPLGLRQPRSTIAVASKRIPVRAGAQLVGGGVLLCMLPLLLGGEQGAPRARWQRLARDHAARQGRLPLREVRKRLHLTYNEAQDNDRTWLALTANERERAWATRGQQPLAADVTLWEQRAAIHEAYQRAALHISPASYPHRLPWSYIEVEHVPARFQAAQGATYAYALWSDENLASGLRMLLPHTPGLARDVNELRGVIAAVPNRHPTFPIEVFTEDVALRHALRAHNIELGQPYSPELAQERRQFYTREAQYAVRAARSHRDRIEADWQVLTPSQQEQAYQDHIAAEGLDAVPELIRVILNAAMAAERQRYLGAAPYERLRLVSAVAMEISDKWEAGRSYVPTRS